MQASVNEAEHAGIVTTNSERYINTGLELGCPSKPGEFVWFITDLLYIYQWVGGAHEWVFAFQLLS